MLTNLQETKSQKETWSTITVVGTRWTCFPNFRIVMLRAIFFNTLITPNLAHQLATCTYIVFRTSGSPYSGSCLVTLQTCFWHALLYTKNFGQQVLVRVVSFQLGTGRPDPPYRWPIVNQATGVLDRTNGSSTVLSDVTAASAHTSASWSSASWMAGAPKHAAGPSTTRLRTHKNNRGQMCKIHEKSINCKIIYYIYNYVDIC